MRGRGDGEELHQAAAADAALCAAERTGTRDQSEQNADFHTPQYIRQSPYRSLCVCHSPSCDLLNVDTRNSSNNKWYVDDDSSGSSCCTGCRDRSSCGGSNIDTNRRSSTSFVSRDNNKSPPGIISRRYRSRYSSDECTTFTPTRSGERRKGVASSSFTGEKTVDVRTCTNAVLDFFRQRSGLAHYQVRQLETTTEPPQQPLWDRANAVWPLQQQRATKTDEHTFSEGEHKQEGNVQHQELKQVNAQQPQQHLKQHEEQRQHQAHRPQQTEQQRQHQLGERCTQQQQDLQQYESEWRDEEVMLRRRELLQKRLSQGHEQQAENIQEVQVQHVHRVCRSSTCSTNWSMPTRSSWGDLCSVDSLSKSCSKTDCAALIKLDGLATRKGTSRRSSWNRIFGQTGFPDASAADTLKENLALGGRSSIQMSSLGSCDDGTLFTAAAPTPSAETAQRTSTGATAASPAATPVARLAAAPAARLAAAAAVAPYAVGAPFAAGTPPLLAAATATMTAAATPRATIATVSESPTTESHQAVEREAHEAAVIFGNTATGYIEEVQAAVVHGGLFPDLEKGLGVSLESPAVSSVEWSSLPGATDVAMRGQGEVLTTASRESSEPSWILQEAAAPPAAAAAATEAKTALEASRGRVMGTCRETTAAREGSSIIWEGTADAHEAASTPCGLETYVAARRATDLRIDPPSSASVAFQQPEPSHEEFIRSAYRLDSIHNLGSNDVQDSNGFGGNDYGSGSTTEFSWSLPTVGRTASLLACEASAGETQGVSASEIGTETSVVFRQLQEVQQPGRHEQHYGQQRQDAQQQQDQSQQQQQWDAVEDGMRSQLESQDQQDPQQQVQQRVHHIRVLAPIRETPEVESRPSAVISTSPPATTAESTNAFSGESPTQAAHPAAADASTAHVGEARASAATEEERQQRRRQSAPRLVAYQIIYPGDQRGGQQQKQHLETQVPQREHQPQEGQMTHLEENSTTSGTEQQQEQVTKVKQQQQSEEHSSHQKKQRERRPKSGNAEQPVSAGDEAARIVDGVSAAVLLLVRLSAGSGTEEENWCCCCRREQRELSVAREKQSSSCGARVAVHATAAWKTSSAVAAMTVATNLTSEAETKGRTGEAEVSAAAAVAGRMWANDSPTAQQRGQSSGEGSARTALAEDNDNLCFFCSCFASNHSMKLYAALLRAGEKSDDVGRSGSASHSSKRSSTTGRREFKNNVANSIQRPCCCWLQLRRGRVHSGPPQTLQEPTSLDQCQQTPQQESQNLQLPEQQQSRELQQLQQHSQQLCPPQERGLLNHKEQPSQDVYGQQPCQQQQQRARHSEPQGALEQGERSVHEVEEHEGDVDPLTVFHSLLEPSISLEAYNQRLARFAHCSSSCFLFALIYICRLLVSPLAAAAASCSSSGGTDSRRGHSSFGGSNSNGSGSSTGSSSTQERVSLVEPHAAQLCEQQCHHQPVQAQHPQVVRAYGQQQQQQAVEKHSQACASNDPQRQQQTTQAVFLWQQLLQQRTSCPNTIQQQGELQQQGDEQPKMCREGSQPLLQEHRPATQQLHGGEAVAIQEDPVESRSPRQQHDVELERHCQELPEQQQSRQPQELHLQQQREHFQVKEQQQQEHYQVQRQQQRQKPYEGQQQQQHQEHYGVREQQQQEHYEVQQQWYPERYNPVARATEGSSGRRRRRRRRLRRKRASGAIAATFIRSSVSSGMSEVRDDPRLIRVGEFDPAFGGTEQLQSSNSSRQSAAETTQQRVQVLTITRGSQASLSEGAAAAGRLTSAAPAVVPAGGIPATAVSGTAAVHGVSLCARGATHGAANAAQAAAGSVGAVEGAAASSVSTAKDAADSAAATSTTAPRAAAARWRGYMTGVADTERVAPGSLRDRAVEDNAISAEHRIAEPTAATADTISKLCGTAPAGGNTARPALDVGKICCSHQMWETHCSSCVFTSSHSAGHCMHDCAGVLTAVEAGKYGCPGGRPQHACRSASDGVSSSTSGRSDSVSVKCQTKPDYTATGASSASSSNNSFSSAGGGVRCSVASVQQTGARRRRRRRNRAETQVQPTQQLLHFDKQQLVAGHSAAEHGQMQQHSFSGNLHGLALQRHRPEQHYPLPSASPQEPGRVGDAATSVQVARDGAGLPVAAGRIHSTVRQTLQQQTHGRQRKQRQQLQLQEQLQQRHHQQQQLQQHAAQPLQQHTAQPLRQHAAQPLRQHAAQQLQHQQHRDLQKEHLQQNLLDAHPQQRTELNPSRITWRQQQMQQAAATLLQIQCGQVMVAHTAEAPLSGQAVEQQQREEARMLTAHRIPREGSAAKVGLQQHQEPTHGSCADQVEALHLARGGETKREWRLNQSKEKQQWQRQQNVSREHEQEARRQQQQREQGQWVQQEHGKITGPQPESGQGRQEADELLCCFPENEVRRRRDSGKVHFRVTAYKAHRLLLTAVTVAAKFFDDTYFANSYYARIGGIAPAEMNRLEAVFLRALDFRLCVHPTDFERCKRAVLRLGSKAQEEAAAGPPVIASEFEGEPSAATCIGRVLDTPPPADATLPGKARVAAAAESSPPRAVAVAAAAASYASSSGAAAGADRPTAATVATGGTACTGVLTEHPAAHPAATAQACCLAESYSGGDYEDDAAIRAPGAVRSAAEQRWAPEALDAVSQGGSGLTAPGTVAAAEDRVGWRNAAIAATTAAAAMTLPVTQPAELRTMNEQIGVELLTKLVEAAAAESRVDAAVRNFPWWWLRSRPSDHVAAVLEAWRHRSAGRKENVFIGETTPAQTDGKWCITVNAEHLLACFSANASRAGQQNSPKTGPAAVAAGSAAASIGCGTPTWKGRGPRVVPVGLTASVSDARPVPEGDGSAQPLQLPVPQPYQGRHEQFSEQRQQQPQDQRYETVAPGSTTMEPAFANAQYVENNYSAAPLVVKRAVIHRRCSAGVYSSTPSSVHTRNDKSSNKCSSAGAPSSSDNNYSSSDCRSNGAGDTQLSVAVCNEERRLDGRACDGEWWGPHEHDAPGKGEQKKSEVLTQEASHSSIEPCVFSRGTQDAKNQQYVLQTVKEQADTTLRQKHPQGQQDAVLQQRQGRMLLQQQQQSQIDSLLPPQQPKENQQQQQDLRLDHQNEQLPHQDQQVSSAARGKEEGSKQWKGRCPPPVVVDARGASAPGSRISERKTVCVNAAARTEPVEGNRLFPACAPAGSREETSGSVVTRRSLARSKSVNRIQLPPLLAPQRICSSTASAGVCLVVTPTDSPWSAQATTCDHSDLTDCSRCSSRRRCAWNNSSRSSSTRSGSSNASTAASRCGGIPAYFKRGGMLAPAALATSAREIESGQHSFSQGLQQVFVASCPCCPDGLSPATPVPQQSADALLCTSRCAGSRCNSLCKRVDTRRGTTCSGGPSTRRCRWHQAAGDLVVGEARGQPEVFTHWDRQPTATATAATAGALPTIAPAAATTPAPAGAAAPERVASGETAAGGCTAQEGTWMSCGVSAFSSPRQTTRYYSVDDTGTDVVFSAATAPGSEMCDAASEAPAACGGDSASIAVAPHLSSAMEAAFPSAAASDNRTAAETASVRAAAAASRRVQQQPMVTRLVWRAAKPQQLQCRAVGQQLQ